MMNPTTSSHMGAIVYTECCADLSIRPNAAVLEQVNVDPIQLVTLRELHCEKTFLGAKGVQAVLKFLLIHQGIRYVDLSGNGVDAAGIALLANVALAHHSLSHINLERNVLTTASARGLLQLATNASRIEEIYLSETGISSDWVDRIAKQAHLNHEFSGGFFPAGIPRPICDWATVFICVLVTPGHEENALLMTDFVMPVINSILSRVRVRVAPMVLLPSTTGDLQAKLNLCKDHFNYGLPWFVAFLGDSISLQAMQLLRVAVLENTPPKIPPLKDKQGRPRDPVRRPSPHAFLYFAPAAAQQNRASRNGKNHSDETPEHVRDAAEFYSKLKAASRAYEIKSKAALVVRIQSDLYSALSATYEQPEATSESKESDMNKHLAFCLRWENDGLLHERETQDIIKWCERPAVGASYPMVLYGASGVGRSFVLAGACQELRRRSAMKVFPYFVRESGPSIVALLWWLLEVFSNENVSKSLPVLSLQSLMSCVHEAINTYSTERESVFVAVIGVEYLDHARRRGNAGLSWLPVALPSNVRFLLGMSTDCPLLATMRKRIPQPHETLVSPLPKKKLVERIIEAQHFRHMKVAGFANEGTSKSTHEMTASSERPVDMLLQKEDAELSLFAPLVASLFKADGVNKFSHDDVASYIQEKVPQTCNGITLRLLEIVSDATGENLTRDIICIVCNYEIPVPDMIEICEGPALQNTPFSTLPALVELRNRGIIYFSSDGLVRLSHPKVRTALASLCSSACLERCIPVVAEYYLRHFVQRTSKFYFASTIFAELLLNCGQHEKLMKCLFDVSLLHQLFQAKNGKVCAIDAFFRVLHYFEQLEELGEDILCRHQFVHNSALSDLRSLLGEVQMRSSKIFQEALLLPRVSPLGRCAIESQPPTISLRRINDTPIEHTSIAAFPCSSAPLIHCAFVSTLEFVTTAADGQVNVWNIEGKCIAHAERLCSSPLLGAVPCGEIILCVSGSRIVLWNYITGSKKEVINTTCSIRNDVLKGTLAVVVDTENLTVALMDVSHGRRITSVPTSSAVIRESHFCGEDVMIVSIYDVIIHQVGGGGEIIMKHDAVIRAVAHSLRDGKFIAACVEAQVFVWSHHGDCLHVCEGHGCPVNDVCFHPNSSLLASCGTDGKVKLWGTLNGQEFRSIESGLKKCEYCQFTPDGTRLVARCGSFLRQWDGVTLEDLGGVLAHSGEVSYFSVTGSHVVSVSRTGDAKIWCLQKLFPTLSQSTEPFITEDLLQSNHVSGSPITHVELNPEKSFVGILSNETLSVWPIGRGGGKPVLNLDNVDCFLFSQTGELLFIRNRCLIALGTDGTEIASRLIAGDVEAETPWQIVQSAEHNLVACIAVFENGVRIFICETAPQIVLRTQIAGHSKPTVAACFIRNALLTASSDRHVVVWSLSSNAERVRYVHSSLITFLLKLSETLFILCDTEKCVHFLECNFAASQITLRSTMNVCGIFVGGAVLDEQTVILLRDDGAICLVSLSLGVSVNDVWLPNFRHCCATANSLGPNPQQPQMVLAGTLTGDVNIYNVVR